MSKPLFGVGLLGIGLLPFVIYFNMLSPSLDKTPEGYSSTIVAFEFVTDQVELKEVLGPLTTTEIQNIDLLNKWDFGFMLIYGSLLFGFLHKWSIISNWKFLGYFKWAALLAVICDAIENSQLLKLSASFMHNIDIENQVFDILHIATWSKWLILAFIFTVIGYSFIRHGFNKLIGSVLLLPVVLGIVAIIGPQRVLTDYFSTSIFVAFLVVGIYALLFKAKPIPST